jgi:hypothetical protein
LNEVANLLPQTPLIVIDGKGDLLESIDPKEWQEVCELEAALMGNPDGPIPEMRNPETGHMVISSTAPAGIERLRYEIIERIGEMRQTNPLELPENWHVRDDSV